MIGTIRRECLDHLIVFNEASLCRHLQAFIGYYHRTRTRLALEKDAPDPRSVELPTVAASSPSPKWGLHHRYERRAA
jgi:putative transposase